MCEKRNRKGRIIHKLDKQTTAGIHREYFKNGERRIMMC